MRSIFLFPFFAMALAACCSARIQITPKGRDTALITSSGSTSQCCLKKAREEAQSYCEKKGGYLSVLSEKTDYLKSARAAKPITATVSTEAGTNANLDANEDYQTTLNFRCR